MMTFNNIVNVANADAAINLQEKDKQYENSVKNYYHRKPH